MNTKTMNSARLLALFAAFLALVTASMAQPVLVSTPVQGKLGYQPGTNFCEAIVTPASSTAYLSGQVGGNATEFKDQVKKVMDGLNTTLTSLGSSMDAVVKSTVFLTNISNFNDMNSVYIQYFTPKTLPARSTVQVASLVGTNTIEIDFIAFDPVFATMKASS